MRTPLSLHFLAANPSLGPRTYGVCDYHTWSASLVRLEQEERCCPQSATIRCLLFFRAS